MSSMSDDEAQLIDMDGYISKWANFLKGWKRRYFRIESPGVLIYFNNKKKYLKRKSRGRRVRCRGTINLHMATITHHKSNKRRFIIDTNTGTYFLRSKTADECKRWVHALNQAKLFYQKQIGDFSVQQPGNLALATSPMSDSEGEDDDDDDDASTSSDNDPRPTVDDNDNDGPSLRHTKGRASNSVATLVSMRDRLAETEYHTASLLQKIEDLVNLVKSGKSKGDVDKRADAVKTEGQELADSVHGLMEGMNEEVERRLRLEALVTFMEATNQDLRRRYMPVNEPPEEDEEDLEDSDDDDFFDTEDSAQGGESSARPGSDTPASPAAPSKVKKTKSKLKHSRNIIPCPETAMLDDYKKYKGHGLIEWRKSLPCPKPSKKEAGASLWSMLKDAIGKDLSRITLPAFYNEPLTVCQRAGEEMAYHNLLHEAAEMSESLRRAMNVCAFAVAPYSATIGRQGKPFNPMLGETWEWDRQDDWGIRLLCEQVSHHPPITAFWVHHKEWVYHGDAQIKSKFWGNSIEVMPVGTAHVHFARWGDHYTFEKVTTCVHSLFGTRWTDHYGEMVITNHSNGEIVKLKFVKKGWVSGQYQLVGCAYDRKGTPKYMMGGHWNEGLYAIPCPEGFNEKEFRKSAHKRDWKNDPNAITLWKYEAPPPECEAMYQLSPHAQTINQLHEKQKGWLAPTDARYRPDQRLLEDGDLKTATVEKVRLEEKQRAARRLREKNGEAWRPRWFEKRVDPDSQTEGWVYTGKYFEVRETQKWDDCPDIW
eukprot:TRINITY_DN17539_c0_g2_i1.p1 TRINITY_DN17539_c0_g2~~TRINITY_DN17539_c0_g2_i1.p1  ORF type:complete len:765 (-),score=225.59 TRINITY_DN17539_c0_g2_i1:117-2411(-)